MEEITKQANIKLDNEGIIVNFKMKDEPDDEDDDYDSDDDVATVRVTEKQKNKLWKFVVANYKKYKKWQLFFEYAAFQGGRRGGMAYCKRFDEHLVPQIHLANGSFKMKLDICRKYKVRLSEESVKEFKEHADLTMHKRGWIVEFKMKDLSDAEEEPNQMTTGRDDLPNGWNEEQTNRMWTFLIENFQKHHVTDLWKKYVEVQGTGTWTMYYNRYRSELIPNYRLFDCPIKTKLEICQKYNIKMDSEYIEELRKHAKIKINGRKVIVLFKMKNESDEMEESDDDDWTEEQMLRTSSRPKKGNRGTLNRGEWIVDFKKKDKSAPPKRKRGRPPKASSEMKPKRATGVRDEEDPYEVGELDDDDSVNAQMAVETAEYEQDVDDSIQFEPMDVDSAETGDGEDQQLGELMDYEPIGDDGAVAEPADHAEQLTDPVPMVEEQIVRNDEQRDDFVGDLELSMHQKQNGQMDEVEDHAGDVSIEVTGGADYDSDDDFTRHKVTEQQKNNLWKFMMENYKKYTKWQSLSAYAKFQGGRRVTWTYRNRFEVCIAPHIHLASGSIKRKLKVCRKYKVCLSKESLKEFKKYAYITLDSEGSIVDFKMKDEPNGEEESDVDDAVEGQIAGPSTQPKKRRRCRTMDRTGWPVNFKMEDGSNAVENPTGDNAVPGPSSPPKRKRGRPPKARSGKEPKDLYEAKELDDDDSVNGQMAEETAENEQDADDSVQFEPMDVGSAETGDGEDQQLGELMDYEPIGDDGALAEPADHAEQLIDPTPMVEKQVVRSDEKRDDYDSDLDCLMHHNQNDQPDVVKEPAGDISIEITGRDDYDSDDDCPNRSLLFGFLDIDDIGAFEEVGGKDEQRSGIFDDVDLSMHQNQNSQIYEVEAPADENAMSVAGPSSRPKRKRRRQPKANSEKKSERGRREVETEDLIVDAVKPGTGITNPDMIIVVPKEEDLVDNAHQGDMEERLMTEMRSTVQEMMDKMNKNMQKNMKSRAASGDKKATELKNEMKSMVNNLQGFMKKEIDSLKKDNKTLAKTVATLQKTTSDRPHESGDVDTVPNKKECLLKLKDFVHSLNSPAIKGIVQRIDTVIQDISKNNEDPLPMRQIVKAIDSILRTMNK